MLPTLDSLEHPWLVLTLLFGVGLLILGLLFELIGMSSWGGFLGLYGVVTIVLGLFGYLGVFSLKSLSRV